MQDYDKNNKPMTKVASTKSPFKQKGENLAPMTKVEKNSAFNLLKNSVSDSSSAKLQKASLLPGRVTTSGGKAPFAK